ncbi:hypothetical protein SODALDRAFT_330217 [Sodiomyces alkalinus F11]|uniref:Pinin/SDK/MemA protein domain-containing protein n=1 Tax=Sodiomyces alkalinus (strain CBS 110278 / VKM F-3762 / F11) TaxID=1314773 RepID=A0A3N2Q155_SODAK|nr:hypothetical protein SODALDRAFT_330217 [Sodiomyces alkalinus F11]ROT40494.1 hypothetical protein SODALDRAFT_330217 [Sodiomyces alkalinus F11]
MVEIEVEEQKATLPDEETGSTPAEDVAAQKRKASSPPLTAQDASPSPKRQKIDDESEDALQETEVNQVANVPTRASDNQDAVREDEPTGSKTARPRAIPSKEEEKKRGQRLFGGLLSTLSQTSSTSSQQKRRREIEQRQQERAQKQKAEGERRLSERLAAVNAVRQEEQKPFEEKVMKTRHANLLARAHSLQTKAEPQIYYRPWKLNRKQADTIDEQISAAKAIISREVEELELRKEEYDRRHGHRRPDNMKRRDEKPTEVVGAADSLASAPPDVHAKAANASPGHSRKGSHDSKDHDESGDIVVEGEEDTVMY